MTELESETPSRPDPDRAAWLLHAMSAAGRTKIDSFQYEELRAEALALKGELASLRSQALGWADKIEQVGCLLQDMSKLVDDHREQHELLRLGARLFLQASYKRDLREGGATVCNIWALLQAGLGEYAGETSVQDIKTWAAEYLGTQGEKA